MSLLSLIFAVIVIGGAFWLVSVLPIPTLIKNVVLGILGIAVLVWIIQVLFRLFPALNVQI